MVSQAWLGSVSLVGVGPASSPTRVPYPTLPRYHPTYPPLGTPTPTHPGYTPWPPTTCRTCTDTAGYVNTAVRSSVSPGVKHRGLKGPDLGTVMYLYPGKGKARTD